MAKTAKQEVTIDIEALEKLAAEINSVDTSISAATGSDAAIRKNIAENLATENASTVDDIVTKIVTQLESLDLKVLIGLRSKLDDVMSESFDSAIKEFLDGEVEKATAGSKEDVSGLREKRKALVESFRALRTILETFGVDVSSVPEPKRSAGRTAGSGASAKTGKNKEGYRFTLDGKERPNSQNTLSSLSYYATEGCAGEGERWGTAQVKEFIKEQGVNFGTDDEWEVTLPNGRKIGARRFTAEEVASFEETPAETTTDATEAPAEDAA